MLDSEQRFQFAVKVVLQHEGGLTNDKNDSGGITNFGISQRFLNDQNLDLNAANITQKQAINIYRQYFWDKYHYNELEGLYVATKVFDMSVNIGPEEGAKILQIACNDLSTKPIAVDGKIGPNTIGKANTLSQDSLMAELRLIMKHYYVMLVKNRPEDSEFLDGWLARAAW